MDVNVHATRSDTKPTGSRLIGSADFVGIARRFTCARQGIVGRVMDGRKCLGVGDSLCYTLGMKKANSSKSRKVRETKAEYRVDVRKESSMTLMEQIQIRLSKLSPEKQREVLDFVAFLQLHSFKLSEPATDIKRGKRIKALLNQLGTMKAFSDIADPVAWQRNTRKDRQLPGRAT